MNQPREGAIEKPPQLVRTLSAGFGIVSRVAAPLFFVLALATSPWRASW
ncbi:hypothetical protein [Streptomyces sp. NPDC046862]